MTTRDQEILLSILEADDQDDASEESEDDDIMMDAISIVLADEISAEERYKKRWWIHPINQCRAEYGLYSHLVKQLQLDDERFLSFFKLSKEQFHEVFTCIEDDITLETTRFRRPIEPKQRLAICLRYLATGESIKSLAFAYRMGATTVGRIIPSVCKAIWNQMKSKYMPMPKTSEEWSQIVEKFNAIHHFPQCCGAIDGKHIMIQAPKNSGSLYHNYKSQFSMVLMAVADAEYKFITVDVGSYGSNNDAGIFNQSKFGKSLKNNTLHLPPDNVLPGNGNAPKVPHAFVGDEGFPLLPNLMRPFGRGNLTEPHKVFNYRLSRARRVVESTFDILATRFRVYFIPRLHRFQQLSETSF